MPCHVLDSPLRVLCVTIALTCLNGCDRPKPLDPGEFTSIAPDIVLTLEYETPEFRVTAHRFSERDRFRVTVETRRDNEFHSCTSDDVFDHLLAEFESLRIRRRVADDEVVKLKQARSYHRLRYASAPPMEAYEEVLSPLPSGFLLVQSEGFAYELSLTTRVVEQLGQSCRSPHARPETGK
jgi:hypothetical protein